jgi:hypothetical protein
MSDSRGHAVQNPAWRPAQPQADRLAHISHHFIGAERPALPDDEPEAVHTLRLVVALADLPGALQPARLAEALRQRLSLDAGSGRWRLDVASTAGAADHHGGDPVLVYATASLAGIGAAYLRIKAVRDRPLPCIGVVLGGGADEGFAQRCFERLASGVAQFLGRAIINLGHMPPPGPEFGTGVAQLAARIRESCNHHPVTTQSEADHT